MRFLIYGPSWRGGAPYSVCNALSKLGHDPELFDYTTYLFRKKIPNKIGSAMDLFFFKRNARVINQEIQFALKSNKFDVFLVHGGLHIWPETVKMARSHCRLVMNWHWDEFFNPVHSSPYIKDAFREYQVILTSRKHLIKEYYDRGAQRVEHINFCFDPDILYPILANSSEKEFWGAQVVFAGSWSQRREQIIANLKDYHIKIWGASWKHAKSSFRRYSNIEIMGRTADCEDMSRAFNSSEICLNILTIENRDQTNVRSYEIPACGAFQLCERTDALLELFEEDEELACYSSPAELLEKVHYYIINKNKRIEIAKAGHEKVMKGKNTYEDRMKEILFLLKEI